MAAASEMLVDTSAVASIRPNTVRYERPAITRSDMNHSAKRFASPCRSMACPTSVVPQMKKKIVCPYNAAVSSRFLTLSAGNSTSGSIEEMAQGTGCVIHHMTIQPKTLSAIRPSAATPPYGRRESTRKAIGPDANLRAMFMQHSSCQDNRRL